MHAITFLALVLAPAAPALKDKPTKGPLLVGRWECTRLVIDGVESPQDKGLEYEFTPDGQWVIYREGRALGGMPRTYRLDPKAGPAVIDLTEREAPYLGMYKVEKDALSLSFRTSGSDRPADPGSAGKGLMTFTFKRVAKE
jgi:uncharacterized protein (TIGR03067 family)